MSRDSAAVQLEALDAPRETLARLDRYVSALSREAEVQNLVSRSTLEDVWSRHVLDSLQLIRLAPVDAKTWVDIGSGAGLPGLVVAALGRYEVTLVEPRRRRVEFLDRTARAMEVPVTVILGKAEVAKGSFDIISARAVAGLPALFAMSTHLAHGRTRMIFPKGRGGAGELEAARQTWQGAFRIEPSLTDPDSTIIIAECVELKTEP